MDTEYKRAANITVVVAGIVFFVWLIFKYAITALMPFFIAAVISALISPIAGKISRVTKIPRKICAASVLILCFAGTLWLLYLAMSRLLMEIGELFQRLSEDPDMICDRLQGISDKLTSGGSRFSFVQRIFESQFFADLGVDMGKVMQDALGSMMSSLTSSLPSVAGAFLKELPSALLFVIVFLIAAFYFSSDGENISKGIVSLLPDKWHKKIPSLKSKLKRTVKGYIKAYLLLMLLTFFEMLIGLLILGVRYAFIMAIIISVVDILPILGTGTVLVPWAVFAILTSNTPFGVGLLVLYAVTLVIRQFAEPKIVGKTLGLHPLATLAAVYLGLRCLGFAGLFIGPMAALLLRELLFKEKTQSTDIVAK